MKSDATDAALAPTLSTEATASPFAETLASIAGPPQSTTAPPAAPVGRERFVTHKVLGEGGMGRVLEADDRQFGRRVAVKELLGAGAESERRFLVEALVTGNLEHPGIPAVYERGEREGRPFYAMKKLEGRPFSALLAGSPSLEARIGLVPIVIRVAHTLGFAHARGIVHRDVKPDNVMVGAHGEVWVVDWGIAKVRGRDEREATSTAQPPIEGAEGATVHGSVLGTPAYMSPEQAHGNVAAIDERTDVFALGAMLYHVLSGRAPYAGPTALATLVSAAEGKHEPLAQAAADAPPSLVAIAERAMAHAREARYPDASTLARELELALARATVAKPSVAVRMMGALASVVALLVALFATVMVTATVSSFAEQGALAPVLAFLSISGIGLAIVDWRTRGAHALLPLSVGLAAFTCAGAIAGTAQAASLVVRFVLREAPAAERADVLLLGLWEGLGIAATGGAYTAVQAVVIALVVRAHALRALDASR